MWRSKFIVAGIAIGFMGLAGRAAWIQVFGNEFFQKQGEVRFARTLEFMLTEKHGHFEFASVVVAGRQLEGSLDRNRRFIV